MEVLIRHVKSLTSPGEKEARKALQNAIEKWRSQVITQLTMLLLASSLSAQPWAADYRGQCDTLYDLANPGPYVENIQEKYITIPDTFKGFWLGNRFMCPDQGIAFQFNNCGIKYETVPHFGFTQPEVELPPYPSFHWTDAGIASGILLTAIGSYYSGYAEGLATVEAGIRTQSGKHFRSSTSHRFRDQGTIGSLIGFGTLAISLFERERQLRLHQPRKGFWYSTDFWPTLGRNILIIGGTAILSHGAAQYGYHAQTKNPWAKVTFSSPSDVN